MGVAPQLRGDQRAAACMDSLALVTLHHHTAGWHQDGCLQMGTSICCQIFRWGNIFAAPHLEAAAFCQKASTAFYFTSESRLGKKCWFESLQLKPNSEVFSQTENRIQKHFVTSRKRKLSCTVAIFPSMKSPTCNRIPREKIRHKQEIHEVKAGTGHLGRL